MSTLIRGNAAEAAVLKALIDAGMHVLVPFGGGLAFDLVAATDAAVLYRLQVKSGRLRNGCVLFNTCSTDHGSGRRDYRGRADFIAVHVPELDRVFVVPVEDCPSYVCSLRVRRPRNNQRRGVRLADDYALEAWADRSCRRASALPTTTPISKPSVGQTARAAPIAVAKSACPTAVVSPEP